MENDVDSGLLMKDDEGSGLLMENDVDSELLMEILCQVRNVDGRSI